MTACLAGPTTSTLGVTRQDDHVRKGVMQMEPMRSRWLMWHLAAWATAVVLLGATAATFALVPNTPEAGWIVLAASIVVILIAGGISRSLGGKLAETFNAWRENGVRLIDADARYAAHQGLGQSDFDQSGLNRAHYNRFSSWSLLSVGDLRTSALSVKHVYTETYYETEYYTDSSGNQQSRQVQKQRTVVIPIFDGMLLALPMSLPHATWVMLQYRKTGLPNELAKMSVASPFLANNYVVGTADQFRGHRALTPTLMEALEMYCQQFRHFPAYSYRDDVLYITIPNYWLAFGRAPGKWSAVTTASLKRVLEECEQSIAFLKDSAERLRPT